MSFISPIGREASPMFSLAADYAAIRGMAPEAKSE
jgi:hypothetical protein